MEAMRLVNEQFLGVWDIYIKFYTAFLTVNLAALGVVVEKVRHGPARKVIGSAFIVQNLLSLGTAVGVAMYSRSVGQAFAGGGDVAVLEAARPLGVWGGAANACSHVLFMALWAAVCWMRLSDPAPGAAAAPADPAAGASGRSLSLPAGAAAVESGEAGAAPAVSGGAGRA